MLKFWFIQFALIVCWTVSLAASENRVTHHELTVAIDPETHSLSAIDVINIQGNEPDLILHLGTAFAWQEISQGGSPLEWRKDEERGTGSSIRYRIIGWQPGGPPLYARWTGTLAEFTGYKVSIIRPDLVELSGFCGWFPTIEPSSQSESFTYAMTLNMPEGWVVLSPQDGVFTEESGGSMEFVNVASHYEDIFICASPGFHRYDIGGSNSSVVLYALPGQSVEAIETDFQAVVALCSEWFGEPATAEDIVSIITPRRGGAEWGYKRGPFWVTGDGFANYLLENDWEIKGLKKSLAAHETIHTWFGNSMGFEQAWLMEAVTQYLEVIVTAALFEQPDLSNRYFVQYRKRFAATKAGIDRPVTGLDINEDHYDHWYLKGSWAFWDLEAVVGRETLIKALASLYRAHVGSVISREDFRASLERSLGMDLKRFFQHWFDEPGFQPLYRGGSSGARAHHR